MSKKNTILCDRNRCTGCRICELVCSGTKEGRFDPRMSRIRVLDAEGLHYKSYSCVQCEGDPACIRSCPRHALARDPETMAVHVETERCDGCGRCAEACPYGAISLVADRGTVIVCDLCAEFPEPRCVTYCPTGALSYVPLTPIPKKTAKKQINISLACNACGECVLTCSSQILKVRDGWLCPEDPTKCQVCEHCSTQCALKAIKINRRSKIVF